MEGECVDAGAERMNPAHAARQNLAQVRGGPGVGEEHFAGDPGGQLAVERDAHHLHAGHGVGHSCGQRLADLTQNLHAVSCLSISAYGVRCIVCGDFASVAIPATLLAEGIGDYMRAGIVTALCTQDTAP